MYLEQKVDAVYIVIDPMSISFGSVQMARRGPMATLLANVCNDIYLFNT